jgi:hypothetical protein
LKQVPVRISLLLRTQHFSKRIGWRLPFFRILAELP